MQDALGDRMKSQYENRTRYLLPRRTWTIIRLDGKAFHTFTRGLDRPFDERFARAISAAAVAVLDEAQGSRFAYIQSDEISVLLTDFERPETCAWFDGNIQKIASVTASVATAHFNDSMHAQMPSLVRYGYFDARVFTIPDPVEVENYFVWRQKDAIRNSILMIAQNFFSERVLHGKSQADVLQMLREADYDWARDTPTQFQRGWFAYRLSNGVSSGIDLETQIPVFTDVNEVGEREYLRSMIGKHGYGDKSDT